MIGNAGHLFFGDQHSEISVVYCNITCFIAVAAEAQIVAAIFLLLENRSCLNSSRNVYGTRVSFNCCVQYKSGNSDFYKSGRLCRGWIKWLEEWFGDKNIEDGIFDAMERFGNYFLSRVHVLEKLD